MSYRHEIPTHLGVEDKLLFGLTVRQLLIIGFGLTIGFSLWQRFGPPTVANPHASIWQAPLPLRVLFAVVPVALAVFVSHYTRGGRTVEGWLFAILRYTFLPKRYTVKIPETRLVRAKDLAREETAFRISRADRRPEGAEALVPAGVWRDEPAIEELTALLESVRRPARTPIVHRGVPERGVPGRSGGVSRSQDRGHGDYGDAMDGLHQGGREIVSALEEVFDHPQVVGPIVDAMPVPLSSNSPSAPVSVLP